tara:strand:+ start:651 stop:1277 length:627 start_codon:yes stop_codon:yes gene_type:complete
MIVNETLENGVINVGELKPNPSNPRSISTKKLNQLKVSIMDFEDMLQLSPIVINQDNIVLGGNMRLRALTELNITQTPYVRVLNLSPEKEKEFVIKDNLTYGDWDWQGLLEDFTPYDLDYFGMDVPQHLFDENNVRGEDLNTISEQFDTWLNNDTKNIKLYFRPENFETMNQRIDELVEKHKVSDKSVLVKLLADMYFVDNNLIKDRR